MRILRGVILTFFYCSFAASEPTHDTQLLTSDYIQEAAKCIARNPDDTYLCHTELNQPCAAQPNVEAIIRCRESLSANWYDTAKADFQLMRSKLFPHQVETLPIALPAMPTEGGTQCGAETSLEWKHPTDQHKPLRDSLCHLVDMATLAILFRDQLLPASLIAMQVMASDTFTLTSGIEATKSCVLEANDEDAVAPCVGYVMRECLVKNPNNDVGCQVSEITLWLQIAHEHAGTTIYEPWYFADAELAALTGCERGKKAQCSIAAIARLSARIFLQSEGSGE